MRKYLYILSAAAILGLGTSCESQLETAPTDSLGSEQIFASANSALTAINGIYRAMYVAEWGSNWEHENGGIMAYIHASDLMGEDHIQNAQGSGWFFYDYLLDIAGDYTRSYGRQAQCWNFFYTLISNANNIIANEENIQDDPDLAKYVVGQAYAMRAYCYLWLVQNFQQPDPELPGVPVYTEPTTIESKGKGRGKVKDVYKRINDDLTEAITRLSATTTAQQHPSHIDVYVAQGIKARALMVQKNYAEAALAAKEALKKPDGRILPFSETNKVNDVAKANVMWGLAVQTDQSPANAGIYAHMDADCGNTYATGAQFLISAWLYDTMPETDARRAWWTAPLPQNEWVEGTSKQSYVQVKLVYKDASLGTGDYVLMRMEEMALIVAEAACHDKDYTTAREYVAMVTSQRDSEWEANLAAVTDGFDINTQTSSTINNLMDYILFQRRVELWGEVSRMHDLQRLGLGVIRDYTYVGNNHLDQSSYEPKSKQFIYAIPQFEFDGNDALDPKVDQNPL